MRNYELMFILKPDTAEETITELKEKLKGVLENFGGEFVEDVAGWGKKRMAYSIDDYQEGIYVLWTFKGVSETVSELDRVIKISDKVLRHIIVRTDVQ